MCINMSRSSESSPGNSESSIDINTLEENHVRAISSKVSPVTSASIPKSLAPSFAAPTAKSLTFSISRLLDSNSSPKCAETEDEDIDDKFSASSDAESPSPISNYSPTRVTEMGAPGKEILFDPKMIATSFGIGAGFDAGQLSSSASSPTNSVIRVPAHRPGHSSMAYSVTYPWFSQTSVPFIKDGMPSEYPQPRMPFQLQRQHRCFIMQLWY